jgi:pimeloyl-ACP methyl ester carboxylesterase
MGSLHAIKSDLDRIAKSLVKAVLAYGEAESWVDSLTRGLASRQNGSLARLYWDGHAVVRAGGRDTSEAGRKPPRALADLLAGLDARNRGQHGAIDVKILTSATGGRNVIVDITGTKDWNAAALLDHDVTNLGTNLRALDGRQTSYEQGVFAALRAAGVRTGDPVMLVGHSQGGMIAVGAARNAREQGFNVTHVVTAGAPIGRTVGRVPQHVQVLALENATDVVPRVDAAKNPDRRNVVTVTGTYRDGSVGGAHGIGTAYQRIAEEADSSCEESIRAFVRSADGFLSATDVRTEAFVVTRGF